MDNFTYRVKPNDNLVLGSSNNDVICNKDLYVENQVVAVNTKMTAWKSHNTSNVTFTATTWTDIEFDTKIEDECLDGISYFDEGEATEDKSIIVIDGFNDIFKVAGCLHTLWTGSAGASVMVASRILFSDDAIIWTEARCLQTLEKSNRGADSEGTIPYNGTIAVNGKTYIKLQVYTSSADMELQGDVLFDNPVSATIHMSNIGNNKV